MNKSIASKKGFSLNPSHWGIQSKIVGIVICIILLTLVTMIVINYISISKSTIKITGENLVDISKEASEKAVQVIQGNINALTAISLSPALVDAVKIQNSQYIGKDQAGIDAEIALLDQAWADEDPSMDSKVEEIQKNATSAYLSQFQSSFPDEVEVFATDIQGLTMAMTNRTGDYLQADEGWWQKAYNNGQGAISVGEVEFDESTNTYGMNIGVPIADPTTKEIVGILRGTINISAVLMTFPIYIMEPPVMLSYLAGKVSFYFPKKKLS